MDMLKHFLMHEITEARSGGLSNFQPNHRTAPGDFHIHPQLRPGFFEQICNAEKAHRFSRRRPLKAKCCAAFSAAIRPKNGAQSAANDSAKDVPVGFWDVARGAEYSAAETALSGIGAVWELRDI